MNSKSLPSVFAISLVIAAVTLAIYIAFITIPSDLGSKVENEVTDSVNNASAFAKRMAAEIHTALQLQPQVIYDGKTVVKASRPIAELSVLEKPFRHTYTYATTWMGSSKRLIIQGDFMVKAGYDLTQPFRMDIANDMKTIRAVLPPAKITSIEQVRYQILEDQSGFWNYISDEDRQNALNALIKEAKQAMVSSDILLKADAALIKQLETIIQQQPENITLIREPQPMLEQVTPPLEME